MNHIESNKLTEADLPKPNAKWDEILKFASTFDLKNEIKEINEGTSIQTVFDVNRSNNIAELRGALYSEWRRYNHVGDFITEGTHEKAQKIIEWLREKLS